MIRRLRIAPLAALLALALLAGAASAEPSRPVLKSELCRMLYNYGQATYGEYQMEADLAATGDAEAKATAEDLAETLESAEHNYNEKGCYIYVTWPWKVD